MLRTLLYSKIHRATVTDANIDYEGSITIDPVLIEAAKMNLYEKVLVVNITNGARFETYIIEGEKNDHSICLNGAAARLGLKGDKVIIMSFAQLSSEELDGFRPNIVKVDDNNEILGE